MELHLKNGPNDLAQVEIKLGVVEVYGSVGLQASDEDKHGTYHTVASLPFICVHRCCVDAHCMLMSTTEIHYLFIPSHLE